MTTTTSLKGKAQPMAASGADLHLGNVTKRFADFTAVDDLTLTVPSGTFFALLGPSGCGKTTTLRMIAGLEQPTSGTISIGGQDVTKLASYQRQVNTVFQSYALFPHMSVLDNVAFGLKRKGVKDSVPRAKAALEMVELEHLASRKPVQLSGGQQQRVALARALVNRPAVLLLDEPLGALDMKLRRQMQVELKSIQTEVGLTFIHVTHDQEEAMTMADTVAVMNKGKIEQMGAPRDLYELPKTAFVANFLGKSNLMHGTVTEDLGDAVAVNAAGHRLVMPKDRSVAHSGAAVVGVRPEKMRVLNLPDEYSPSANMLTGTVLDASFTGVSTEYLVEVQGIGTIGTFSQNMGQPPAQRGDTVRMTWEPEFSFGLDGAEEASAGRDAV
ncbi:ABC transporter ATP-binding protein [Paeniglutamicibacter psychrophenolicus]|uniref:ABC transporter ATP-binding protein n=1 Tax=Paeniglutamicibacter psychrophenolicus TaxID=257454 RepID=UPI0027856673|nr:ABC transporter ATP-binding protein [Paeniglutamicibacter psychrophenolicus]MDQ0095199.1 spermidine/putrescine transport system ATP-binding protein [Paeniglutamicibacter psychrophenolicus]